MAEFLARTYSNFSELPEPVKDFIYDPDDEDSSRIIDVAGLDGPATKIFFEETEKAYLGKMPLTGLFSAIRTRLPNLPEDKTKILVRDFIAYRFLPIDDFLNGQATAVLVSMGRNPADFNIKRVMVRTMPPADVVTEFLHEHPVNVPAFLEHRMREILESRVRGVRKDAETVQRLTRAEKIGGAEMAPAEAEKLVEELASKIANINVAYEQPTPLENSKLQQPESKEIPNYNNQNPNTDTSTNIKVSSEPAAQPLPPKPTLLAVSRQGHGVTPEDEKEAEAFRSKIEHEISSPTLSGLDDAVKAAAEKLVLEHGANLPSDLKARFKTIVESRLKGIRDQAETTDLLGREASKGGMGYGPSLVDDIVRAIEKQSTAIHGEREEAVKKEKETFVKTSVANTYAKDESRKRGEQEEIDRMYSSLTGNKKARQVQPVQQPNSNNQIPHKVQEAKIQTPSQTVSEPLVTNPQPLISKPSAPAPSPYMYTPPAVISPKMRDVRPVEAATPAARLTGPVEELRNMTLTDFRRLSTDPAEACRKLADKLDLLEGHSYTQRTEGVKAWKESEVYKMYMQILTASFAGGKPIPAFIAEAMAANRPTLTEREVHAIMELNRQLKA